jgi:hypothetical protein
VFCMVVRMNSDCFPVGLQHGQVFVMETEYIYCAVRADFLNIVQVNFSL